MQIFNNLNFDSRFITSKLSSTLIFFFSHYLSSESKQYIGKI